jgi:hypothetical protein
MLFWLCMASVRVPSNDPELNLESAARVPGFFESLE